VTPWDTDRETRVTQTNSEQLSSELNGEREAIFASSASTTTRRTSVHGAMPHPSRTPTNSSRGHRRARTCTSIDSERVAWSASAPQAQVTRYHHGVKENTRESQAQIPSSNLQNVHSNIPSVPSGNFRGDNRFKSQARKASHDRQGHRDTTEGARRILRGIQKLANAVQGHPRPLRRVVVLEKSLGAPTVTKDGVTISRKSSSRISTKPFGHR